MWLGFIYLSIYVYIVLSSTHCPFHCHRSWWWMILYPPINSFEQSLFQKWGCCCCCLLLCFPYPYSYSYSYPYSYYYYYYYSQTTFVDAAFCGDVLWSFSRSLSVVVSLSLWFTFSLVAILHLWVPNKRTMRVLTGVHCYCHCHYHHWHWHWYCYWHWHRIYVLLLSSCFFFFFLFVDLLFYRLLLPGHVKLVFPPVPSSTTYLCLCLIGRCCYCCCCICCYIFCWYRDCTYQQRFHNIRTYHLFG